MSDRTFSEVIADELRPAGYSMGVVGYLDGQGRSMWAADANRPGEDDRYIARADSEQGAWVALKGMVWEGDGL